MTTMRNFSLGNTSWSAVSNWLTLLLLGASLAACGGGGGDPTIDGGISGGTTGPVAAKVSVTLYNAAGQFSIALSNTTPLTVKASVVDANGAPVSNALVTFSTDKSLATLSTTNSTTLTDAKGVASITLAALNSTVTGAGKVTATVAAGPASVSGEVNYEIKTAQASSAQLALSLLRGTNASHALSSATPLTARALLSDLSGTPVSGDRLVFSTDHTLADISSLTGIALTDAAGQVHMTLRPLSLSESGGATLIVTAAVSAAIASNQGNYSGGATELALAI
ncbi:hypothetical protein [Janthinobacterium sp. 75]|uniref:Ig-like domain-containing protein n=1 Tax=Janthinobacterium sp. 75 TaxID=2135628 RepID=UPI00106274D0|nr:hypothetical protein [Janthinobacterium sp. 75]